MCLTFRTSGLSCLFVLICQHILSIICTDFGLESTYLKHNLDICLSEETWCWMSHSSNIMTTYIKKDEKCMKTEVNSFSVPWTRKLFPLILCIGKCHGLGTIFLKTSRRCLKFILYHAVIQIFWILLPPSMPKLCSRGFNCVLAYEVVTSR